MDKKKVTKPKVKKPIVPKKKVTKPKGKNPIIPKKKVKKINVKKPISTKKIKHKGGARENIGTTTGNLFKSIWDFGGAIYTEIDLLTKTPGQLGKIAN
jgi:hypothetical protein